MTDTSQKLMEADRLLRRMIQSQGRPDVFKADVGAFLDAVRRVPSMLLKEFGACPVFMKWYEKRWASVNANRSVKVLISGEAMDIRPRPARGDVNGDTPLTESVSIATSCGDGMTVLYDPPPSAVQQHWYFDVIPEMDVVAVCEECMDSLKSMVSDCERVFGCP